MSPARASDRLLYLLAGVPWIFAWLTHQNGAALLAPAVSSALLLGAMHRLIRYRSSIAALEIERARLSATDPLTRLGNSSALEESLVREVARAKRTGHPLCCLFFDVNNFKSINDQYGHTAGNLVLQTIGDTILKSVRNSLDLAFRYGGDEFLILMPETDKPQAIAVGYRLRDSLAKTGPPLVPAKKVSFSMGVAKLRDSHRAADLLAVVDRSIHQPGRKGSAGIYDADDPASVEQA